MYSVNCYYPKNGVKLNDTNMIKNVYHIGIPDKSGFTIWDTEKQRYCWQDKAGGYGIQTPFGMKHIKKIDGDYYNVVGLPVSKLYQVLRNEFDFEM